MESACAAVDLGGRSTSTLRHTGGLRHETAILLFVAGAARAGGRAGAAGRGGARAQYSVLADAAAGRSAGATTVHDVVSAGVKEATPEQDDGGFGFFGAIAEMIEAENAR